MQLINKIFVKQKVVRTGSIERFVRSTDPVIDNFVIVHTQICIVWLPFWGVRNADLPLVTTGLSPQHPNFDSFSLFRI